MGNIIKTTFIILIIYGLFLVYLFIASDRFEKLEKNYQKEENVLIKLNN